ncbi:protein REVEILLE 6-like [Melia azedarach]|uniref:Protein REVEILLE 6-like n=1 Tax=Melia azedarach TaxID=155640 RepID=A0ACC1Z046_MELAZ|nr:protein REVEILLE 6-like [Melia azedarach]
MVSVNPNPAQGFFFFDPMNMGHPGLNSLPTTNNYNATATSTTTTTASTKSANYNTMSFMEDPSKKIRKPYTITKSRESWTEQEHDKFLEALQLFDRDWKKIEAFIGSKTVIQIRSHAQKYFLKVQKNGTSEHVPPPRPKRKAAHPYPQKAPKTTPGVSQIGGPFQSSAALLEPGYIYRPDSSSVPGNPIPDAALSSWSYNSVPPVSVSQVTKDDVGLAGPTIPQNCCYSSSNESTPRTWSAAETIDRGNHGKPPRVMPDFSQVYSFLGSVFDPNATGHIQRLKQMDPINFETVLLLMKNLAINLTSPEFENHRRLLSVYDTESQRNRFGSPCDNLHAGKSESAIPSA